MASKTFYLKYRPQKISELDSVDIRQKLEKVLKSGKIPHALLFTGPRGAGKTSAARIVAKAINCAKTQNAKRKTQNGFEPCNRCSLCREITEGRALDLLEIDAASNRGIDDIRNLREKIRLAPTRAKYKVYIIDEAHMLTTEAFNALLKTLEEPPAHAVFILCTTAPEKLPETIISRCLRFNFEKATLEEIVKGPLKRAVKGEKLKVEKGVLKEIAHSVDGSFRDAHKLLEQLSFGSKKITLKETKELLGKIEALAPKKLLSLLAAKDTKAALLEIDRIVEAGGNLMTYVQEMLGCLRLAMLVKIGLNEQPIDDDWVAQFSLEELRRLIQFFSRAATEMKTNPIPQLPLELVVVEWGESGDGARAARQNFDSASDSARKIPSELTGQARESRPAPPDEVLAGSQSETSQNLSVGQRSQGDGLKEIKERWDELLAGVKPLNHSVEALLRAARPAKIDGEFLTLEVFYKFHKERLETEKCRLVVEEVASQILGMPIKLLCILGSKRPTANPDFKRDYTDKSAKSGFQPVSAASSTMPAGRQAGGPADDDIMKTAEEIFGV